MFIDTFIEIFEKTCISLIGIIPAVIGLWLIFDLLSNLLFKD